MAAAGSYSVNFRIEPFFCSVSNKVLFYQLKIRQSQLLWSLNKTQIRQIPGHLNLLHSLSEEFRRGVLYESNTQELEELIRDLAFWPQTLGEHAADISPSVYRVGPHCIQHATRLKAFAQLDKTGAARADLLFTQLTSWKRLKEARQQAFLKWACPPEQSLPARMIYTAQLVWIFFACNVANRILHSVAAQEHKLVRRVSLDKIKLFKHYEEQTIAMTKAISLVSLSYSKKLMLK